MNRVTIINLAGRATHVEDDGVEAIDRWMESARATLRADPDRDELLADFEEAIADRFAVHAQGATDVVTAAQVEDVLTALGPVEPADFSSTGGDALGGDGDEAAGDAGVDGDEAGATTAESGGEPLRQRRLYRLTGDGEGMIAGVAAGIGSYLNIDVTVVRLVAILLAIVSFGATVLVYVGLALIVPVADSPHERMAAKGYGATAKEVMSRARTDSRPALASVGSALRVGLGAVSAVVMWTLMLAISAVVIGGGIAVSAVFVDPEPLATAFDAGTSTWTIAVWVSSGFWLAAGALILLVALFRRLSAPSRNHALSAAVGAVGLVMMTTAAIGFVAIPMAASTQMRSIMDGEGQIEIFGEVWCLTPEFGFEEDIEDCDARSSSAVIGREWAIEGTSRWPEVERRLTVVRERVGELELRLGFRSAR